MIEQQIKSSIREVKDFPREGILFKDITPILLDTQLCHDIMDAFNQRLEKINFDVVLAVESRGFIFGFFMAQHFKVPFIPVRKEGKLPGEIISHQFDLEYGKAVVEIHKDDLVKGSQVLIHDDLLATGGTAAAAASLVERLGAKVSAFSFLVSLEFLNGRNKLTSYSSEIITLASY